MTLPFRLASRLLFALLLFSSSARAEDDVLLVVHGDELPREVLRARLAKELGRPVVLAGTPAGGVVTVTYRAGKRELAVTWDGPKHGTVSRVVAAPEKSDDVVRDAAMLASELARDEADELAAPPAPAAAPAPPPTPAAPPKMEPITAGFFFPLASNLGRPHARTHVDLNVIHGRVGELAGFQLGGVNVVAGGEGANGDAGGLQWAWLGNVVTGRLEGWQAAGIFNRAAISASGLQTAPVNLAGDVTGAQLGVVNVARKVNGAMIGVINVADDVSGLPIGLVSVTKTGGVHPRAWASNATYGNVGLQFATRYTYTMPTGHYHHGYDRDFYGAGLAVGGHVQLSEGKRGAYVDLEVSCAWLVASERTVSAPPVETFRQHLLQPRVRALFGYRILEHLGVFGGVGVGTQARFLHTGDEVVVTVGPDFSLGFEL